MSHTRRIELACKSGDGTVATASAPGGAEYVILRTSNGRPVHLEFADGRELASWLIEHCTEAPDATLVSQDEAKRNPLK